MAVQQKYTNKKCKEHDSGWMATAPRSSHHTVGLGLRVAELVGRCVNGEVQQREEAGGGPVVCGQEACSFLFIRHLHAPTLCTLTCGFTHTLKSPRRMCIFLIVHVNECAPPEGPKKLPFDVNPPKNHNQTQNPNQSLPKNICFSSPDITRRR